jgi:hypothetical protein
MAQLMMVAGVHKTERLSGYGYMNLLGTLTSSIPSSPTVLQLYSSPNP